MSMGSIHENKVAQNTRRDFSFRKPMNDAMNNDSLYPFIPSFVWVILIFWRQQVAATVSLSQIKFK